MTDDNYEDLVRRVDEIKNNKAQGEGALAEMLKQAREEFGVETVEEIRTKLAELKRRGAKVDKKADAAYERFMEKFGDKL